MYETQYRFSGRLVYPRPWSEFYHISYINLILPLKRYISEKTKDVNLQKGKTSCIHVSGPYFLTIQSAHSYSLIYTSSNHMNLKKTIADIHRLEKAQQRQHRSHVRDEKHQCEPRGPDSRCGVRLLRKADGHLFIRPEGEGVGPAGERGVGLLC